MKTFVDQETGRKFQLGKRGAGALTERVEEYVQERRDAGAQEVSLYPTNIPAGSKFKCDTCDQEFTFDGEDQDAFVQSIMDHGRAHGQCKILPVI